MTESKADIESNASVEQSETPSLIGANIHSSRQCGECKANDFTGLNPVTTHKPLSRTEVQAHGFSWEQELLKNVYLATSDELATIGYTSKIDLPAKFNRLNPANLSIKTSCNPRSVCMADCLRMFDATNGPECLHLVVLHYKQRMHTKKLVNVIEIDLSASSALLFGTITRDSLVELDKLVKSVPQKRKPTKEEHRRMYELRDRLQPQSGAIHLDIKCNSTQSRLQCSFNQFAKFVDSNQSRVIEKSDTNRFRGGEISSEIVSPSRVFKQIAT